MDKPKDNNCTMFFHCYHPQDKCVYYEASKDKSGEGYKCKYGYIFCESKVAQANRMVLKLKKEGVKYEKM